MKLGKSSHPSWTQLCCVWRFPFPQAPVLGGDVLPYFAQLQLLKLNRDFGGRRFGPTTTHLPSLKLTAKAQKIGWLEKPPKMDGWKTILSFWGLAYFQVLLLLVSGSAHNSSFKYKPLLLQYPFVHPKIAIFVAMFSTCSCFFVTFCCPQNFLSDFCTPGSRAGPVPVAAKGCYSQEASPYHLVPISFEHMGLGSMLWAILDLVLLMAEIWLTTWDV